MGLGRLMQDFLLLWAVGLEDSHIPAVWLLLDLLEFELCLRYMMLQEEKKIEQAEVSIEARTIVNKRRRGLEHSCS